MSSAPRFENQQIVNSFNLFIDSERATIQGDRQSRGDDVFIQFEGNSVEAQDGEIIRLSLKEFSMPNVTTMVDMNNSRGTIKATSAYKAIPVPPVTVPPTPPDPFGIEGTHDLLTRMNYENVYDIAYYFGLNLKNYLDTLINPLLARYFTWEVKYPFSDDTYVPSSIAVAGPTGSATFPAYEKETNGRKPMSTDVRWLQIEFTCKEIGSGSTANPTGSVANHTITDLVIQLTPQVGDTYLILGGQRCDDANSTTFKSLQTDITSTKITVTGWYPMLRYSEPSIYIRTNTGQNGLEMSVLQADSVQGGNALLADVVSSNILGKVNRFENGDGGGEYIYYNASTDVDYFVNLQQRKLTNLRLFLTDSKGRKLGRRQSDSAPSGTAAGREAVVVYPNEPKYGSLLQNELGNMYFTAVLRVDVIKASCPARLETKVFPPPENGSKNGGIIPYNGYPNRF